MAEMFSDQTIFIRSYRGPNQTTHAGSGRDPNQTISAGSDHDSDRYFARLPDVREKEVWRYAGYRGIPEKEEEPLQALLSEMQEEALPLLDYKVCYRILPLEWDENRVRLPFSSRSVQLEKMLQGCSHLVIFAATIGLGFDRLLAGTLRRSPARALLLQALGSERVEALCDVFCREIEEEAFRAGKETTTRFSPGYGDLPLSVQRDLFQLLDCSRKIGVYLTDSLLMRPEKSVTAVFGLRERQEDCIRTGSQGECADRSGTGSQGECAGHPRTENHSPGADSRSKCRTCTKTDCLYRIQDPRS